MIVYIHKFSLKDSNHSICEEYAMGLAFFVDVYTIHSLPCKRFMCREENGPERRSSRCLVSEL